MRLDLDALDKFAAASAAAPDDSLSERLFEIELRVAWPAIVEELRAARAVCARIDAEGGHGYAVHDLVAAYRRVRGEGT